MAEGFSIMVSGRAGALSAGRLPWTDLEKSGAALASSEQANAIARNRAAVAQLYETHFERVARYVGVRIGHGPEAEDLASEVFLRALRSADRFQEKGVPMEAWIFTIAHNVVVDHLRRHSRRPVMVSLEEGASASSSEDPTEGVERAEEAQKLGRAMQHLTEEQRQVISLRFGAEMTSEQIAQVMKKKPGAVREQQSAAVRRLRKLYERAE